MCSAWTFVLCDSRHFKCLESLSEANPRGERQYHQGCHHSGKGGRGYRLLRRKHGIQDIVLGQYGTLGGGNHFIEVCLDTKGGVWVMLHCESRGMDNEIGRYFIELARDDMRRHMINLPDENLAYRRSWVSRTECWRWEACGRRVSPLTRSQSRRCGASVRLIGIHAPGSNLEGGSSVTLRIAAPGRSGLNGLDGSPSLKQIPDNVSLLLWFRLEG